MSGTRQKKHKTVTRAARAIAAMGVLLSLLSIQQVWAEGFCTCDHQDSSASAGAHCTKHAAQHEHSEEAHCAAAVQRVTQSEDCEEAHSSSSHHHAAQPVQSENTESLATAAHSPEDSDHDQVSGVKSTARVEAGANASRPDGSNTPSKLDCCHMLPAANLPAASFAVYGADVAIDSTPVAIDSAPVRTLIPSIVFHPPPSRPIYVTISSFLI